MAHPSDSSLSASDRTSETVRKILIVDDEPSVHQMLAAALASPGRVIETASDSFSALRRIQAAPYDLVITDMRMPGMDGLELLGRIREASPATKVIVMTGAGAPADVIRSLRGRAFAYFSKPFAPSAVADVISEALRTPSWEDDIEVVSARPEWITLSVRCRPGTADRLVGFLREVDISLTEKTRDEIAVAFRELLMNAIEHGGNLDPEKRLRLAYIRTSRAVLYYIEDPGEGFSLEQLPHAAVSNPPGEPCCHLREREQRGIRPGGFGILLARNLVDELMYSEKGNEVLLIKYLTP